MRRRSTICSGKTPYTCPVCGPWVWAYTIFGALAVVIIICAW